MVNPSSIMPFVSTQRGVFTESKVKEDDEMSETTYDVQKTLTEVSVQIKCYKKMVMNLISSSISVRICHTPVSTQQIT